MNKPVISLIAALDENRGIGRDNHLIFHISNDLKRFKKLTLGHPVIMGRKTYQSIGKALPGRTNIIISKNPQFHGENIVIKNSMENAINYAKEIEKDEIFVIGGAQVYQQAISSADKLYLTLIKGIYDADVFFPDYSQFKKEVYKKDEEAEGYKYTFVDLVK